MKKLMSMFPWIVVTLFAAFCAIVLLTTACTVLQRGGFDAPEYHQVTLTMGNLQIEPFFIPEYWPEDFADLPYKLVSLVFPLLIYNTFSRDNLHAYNILIHVEEGKVYALADYSIGEVEIWMSEDVTWYMMYRGKPILSDRASFEAFVQEFFVVVAQGISI